MAGLLNSTLPGTPAPTPTSALPPGVTTVNGNQLAGGTPSTTNVAGAPNIAAHQMSDSAPTTIAPTHANTGSNLPVVTPPASTTPNGGLPITPAPTPSTISTSSTSPAPTPTPTPTPAPGVVVTPSPTPTPTPTPGPAATTADINADFNADFGRPAASAGEAFYEQALENNPNMTAAQLNALIESGAQTQDQAAEASLNGSGNLSKNWTQTGLDAAGVGSGSVTWNPQTGQWETAAQPNAGGTALPTANWTGYTAAMDTVTPQATAAGQFINDTNVNNPLMQEAATQGNEQANARGLLNSSIGISAVDQAMYNAALPMSEQDASTYANANLANQSATNAASQFTANAENQASLADLSTATQVMLQNMQDATTAATAKLSSTTQLALGQLSSQTQQTVQSMVNTNQQLLQTSTSAANTFNTAMNNIATIQNSTTMDAGAKQTAVNTILTELQNFMSAQTSTAQAGGATNLPNLSQYFPGLTQSNFTSGGGDTTSGANSGTPGTGTTPPTGASVGSTYTSQGITYTVGTDGTGNLVGIPQNKITG